MNMNTISNIKVCSDKILLILQISKEHTLEETIILELKFGTKRKNRKLRRSLRPGGLNQTMCGIPTVGMYFELSMECHMKLRIQALKGNVYLKFSAYYPIITIY